MSGLVGERGHEDARTWQDNWVAGCAPARGAINA